ncbi:MAG: gliding motility-associated C-terminal domain-containing protein [Bacteroidia bacterium]
MIAFIFKSAIATHLVGGSFTVKWLGGNSYEIILKVLRDCENGSPRAYFDFPLTAGIFDKVTHQQKTTVTFTNNDFVKDDTLDFTGDNCPDIITGCTHIGIYRRVIQMPGNSYNSNGGYYISWERCCRNNIINNIVRPQDAGLVIYAEFPNTQFIKNSTPYFTNNPVTLLCANNLFKYNFKFVDDDGDELRYSLIEPLNGTLGPQMPANNGTPASGPYPTTIWSTGYANDNVIPGTVPLKINPGTGEIEVNPASAGIYVASIRVEEFRFNQKIGEVRLELQFTVTNCLNQPPLSSVISTENKIITDTIYVEIPEKLQVRIRTIDTNDSITVRIKSDFADSLFKQIPIYDSIFTGFMVAETLLNWQTNCEHNGINKAITFEVDAIDNGCPIARNSKAKFFVKIIPKKLLPAPKMLCMTLVENKQTIFYWGNNIETNNKDFKQYYIYKIINSNKAKLLDSVTSLNQRFYIDPNTPDYSEINYGYFIRTVNNCDSIGPPSDTIFTFEQLKFIPDKQRIKYVTVKDNKYIELNWPETWEKDHAKYFLYKSTNNGTDFNLLRVFEEPYDTMYLDEDVEVSKQSYCYHLVMMDTCDNVGPMGYVSCSILLKGEAGPYFNTLNWSAYRGWEQIEDYTLLRSDPATAFAAIQTFNSDMLRCVDDKLNLNEGLFSYYVSAKEQFTENKPYFNASSLSNVVELFQKPIVYMPNAFTLNNDGLNDTYYWLPVFVKDFNIQIYNRWGEKVFETNNKNQPWNGTYNGKIAPSDVYFYKLFYTGWEGTEKSQSGNFTLIR